MFISRTKRAEELADRLCKDGYRKGIPRAARKTGENRKTRTHSLKVKSLWLQHPPLGWGWTKRMSGWLFTMIFPTRWKTTFRKPEGREGDESISAECYILYNDDDLNKHFVLLNQTKLQIQEIQQVWEGHKKPDGNKENRVQVCFGYSKKSRMG